MSWLWVDSRYGQRFLVIPAGPESQYMHRGSAKPPSRMSTEYLVRVGWTYHTDKVGDLVPEYFLSCRQRTTVYLIETNLSPRYGSKGWAQYRCTVLPAI